LNKFQPKVKKCGWNRNKCSAALTDCAISLLVLCRTVTKISQVWEFVSCLYRTFKFWCECWSRWTWNWRHDRGV